jgi:hypothetical protein
MGIIDWLTTVIGTVYFGATEANPLLANLTQTNLMIFSAVKLSVTLLVGFLFYRGFQIEKTARIKPQMDRLFLQGGYFLSLGALTVVVANNFLAVAGVL